MTINQKLFPVLFLQLILVLSPTNLFAADAKGQLRLVFYRKTCLVAKEIIRNTTAGVILRAPNLAASLLRLQFHDCFVRNNGPFWKVPTGRRDGMMSSASEVITNLPAASSGVAQLKQKFHEKGLTTKDLVVLSGSHTVGMSHCSSFSRRLYNFSGEGGTDPTLEPRYAAKLKSKCKPGDLTKEVEMDPGRPEAISHLTKAITVLTQREEASSHQMRFFWMTKTPGLMSTVKLRPMPPLF